VKYFHPEFKTLSSQILFEKDLQNRLKKLGAKQDGWEKFFHKYYLPSSFFPVDEVVLDQWLVQFRTMSDVTVVVVAPASENDVLILSFTNCLVQVLSSITRFELVSFLYRFLGTIFVRKKSCRS
jgi:hypothetical protein